jgi:hypothetical protein
VAGLGWLVLNTLLGPERTTRTVPGGAFVVLAPLGVVPGWCRGWGLLFRCWACRPANDTMLVVVTVVVG